MTQEKEAVFTEKLPLVPGLFCSFSPIVGIFWLWFGLVWGLLEVKFWSSQHFTFIKEYLQLNRKKKTNTQGREQVLLKSCQHSIWLCRMDIFLSAPDRYNAFQNVHTNLNLKAKSTEDSEILYLSESVTMDTLSSEPFMPYNKKNYLHDTLELYQVLKSSWVIIESDPLGKAPFKTA